MVVHSNKRTRIVILTLAALVVVAAIALVVVFVFIDSDGSSSSSTATISAASAGGTASGLKVNVLPASSSSRRSFSGFEALQESVRRAVDSTRRAGHTDLGTPFSDFKTSLETSIPGSEVLGTVNMIVCFVGSTGMFVVQNTPYKALVDMSACQNGQRGSQKEVYDVTVFDTVKIQAGEGYTFEGNVGFTMQGAELKAIASFTIITTRNPTCPGVFINTKGGLTTCWTGGVRWNNGIMSGYFKGEQSPDPSFPGLIKFYETESGNTKALVVTLAANGNNVRAKISDTQNSKTYCMNANKDYSIMASSATPSLACNTPQICLSRATQMKYPFNYVLFKKSDGSRAVSAGITSLGLEYTKSGKRCYLGISGSGSFISCGQGQASSGDIIGDGGTADSFSGDSYTIHHSNAKVQKFTVQELSLAEFSSGFYMSYYTVVSSTFWQYILGHDGTNWIVQFKRSWGGAAWNSFTADGSTTQNVGSNDQNFWPCKKDARYYTGADAPTNSDPYGKFQIHSFAEYTLDPVAGKVFVAKSNGLQQVPSSDLSLVCPTVCTRDDGTNCQEYTKCPKTSFNGMDISNVNQCTGGSCTFFERAVNTDTARVYTCLLYTSPSPRDRTRSRMPSSA
eukprot:TRINITY_DN3770_c0_g1_i1.p1 TRINITY_DN3770_c0_g1~~TRINITY_DN3770_c0_g1_i1.p1  ORF type:complete len:622 (-),score=183.48 TRINITY_DN3770_c0_g1_i1:114-1979(-)